MTFWETIERGEYVMFALTVFLIIIICIWWIRGAKLSSLKKRYSPLMQRIRDYIIEGDVENARHLCDVTDSPGARLIGAGLGRVGSPMQEVKESMNSVAAIEKSNMTKGAVWLKAFAVISPLVGLGGTLLGIIDRLRDLGESGGGVDIAMVCGAIAPTIVSTVAGLGVGIFSLFALAGLESSINSAERHLDRLGVDFTNLLNEPS